MGKIYFSHDADAHNDPKILAMRCEYGLEGYGLYWVIVEMMRSQEGFKLPLKKYSYNAIAMQTQTKIDVAKFVADCTEEYELFENDESHFWSNSLLKRMEHMQSVSEKRKAAASKRWGKKNKKEDAAESKPDANALQTDANAMQNDANINININKKDIKTLVQNEDEQLQKEFDEFWSIYPRKEGKKTSQTKFKTKRKKFSFEQIMAGVKRYVNKCDVEQTEKKFIKMPTTFLNGDHFTEEHEAIAPKQKAGTVGTANKWEGVTDE